MGFLTIVAISNDFWHKIKEDPEFIIDQIGMAMNYGSGRTSPINDVHRAERREDDEHRRRHDWEMEYLKPQGLEVFKAKHYDEPQVIVNTYGTQPIDAAELPYAISRGWLDLNKYNAEHAENVAKELHRLAADIRAEVRKHEKGKTEDK